VAAWGLGPSPLEGPVPGRAGLVPRPGLPLAREVVTTGRLGLVVVVVAGMLVVVATGLVVVVGEPVVAVVAGATSLEGELGPKAPALCTPLPSPGPAAMATAFWPYGRVP
jgi:hypothetical protein